MDICVAEIELCRVCLEPHKETPTLGRVALREGKMYTSETQPHTFAAPHSPIPKHSTRNSPTHPRPHPTYTHAHSAPQTER